jgi:hypothetical protein
LRALPVRCARRQTRSFIVLHDVLALVALITFACGACACTPYKARPYDRNEGGGSSMFRDVDPAGAR